MDGVVAGVNLANGAGCVAGHCTDPLVQGGALVNADNGQFADICRLVWEAYPLNGATYYGANQQGCTLGDNIFAHVASTSAGMSWHIVDDGASGGAPSNFSCSSAGACNPPNNVATAPDGHVQFKGENQPPDAAHGLLETSIPNFGDEYFTTPKGYAAAVGWKYLNQMDNYTDWVVKFCGLSPCVPQVVKTVPTGTDVFSGFTDQWLRAN